MWPRGLWFKSFYHKEIMGLSSGFPEITETSSAHGDKMNCRSMCYVKSPRIESLSKLQDTVAKH